MDKMILLQKIYYLIFTVTLTDFILICTLLAICWYSLETRNLVKVTHIANCLVEFQYFSNIPSTLEHVVSRIRDKATVDYNKTKEPLYLEKMEDAQDIIEHLKSMEDKLTKLMMKEPNEYTGDSIFNDFWKRVKNNI